MALVFPIDIHNANAKLMLGSFEIKDVVNSLLFFRDHSVTERFQKFYRRKSSWLLFMPLLILTYLILSYVSFRNYSNNFNDDVRARAVVVLVFSIASTVSATLKFATEIVFAHSCQAGLLATALENIFIFCLTLQFGLLLLFSTIGQQCEGNVTPIGDFCNPLRYAETLPYGSAMATLFIPVMGMSLLRYCNWGCILLCWLTSICFVVACVIIVDQPVAILALLFLGLVSFAVIFERRLISIEYFIAFNKEFDYLALQQEKELAEAKHYQTILKHNELRHTIANLAHDLKTVSHQFYRSYLLHLNAICSLFVAYFST